ncbi:MAG: error-prone DNA polymerase [Bryobacterales bacterium]|nr:error-prone DNA polymerase [Bryobacterales bacterium]
MYVELHSASGFSFLEGASDPEDLVSAAAGLGCGTLALCDRDSVSGAPRLFSAARAAGVRALVGCEISLEQPDVRPKTPNAVLDRRLTVLVESRAGYRNLCRLLTRMNLRAPKGQGRARWEEVEEHREGLVALLHDLRDEDTVRGIFGPDRLYVELQRHMVREQERGNQARIELARAHGLPLLATNGVRYDTARRKPLHDALTCLRFKRKLDNAGRLLDPNAERHIKSAEEMERLFSDIPEAVANTAELAQRIAFTLEDLGYRFPSYPLPPGETEESLLRRETLRGASARYRGLPHRARAMRQIEHELEMISKLGLAGYFLIVWDISEFARKRGILCQGRGSAANSAVCYSLGITAVDPVGMDLLFERFLSEERGEWPDIDLDLPSGAQRERVIQHVYARYGQRGAAMTANVITYRRRSAVREMGKVLGFPEEMIARLAKAVSGFEYTDSHDSLLAQAQQIGLDRRDARVSHWLRLCLDIRGLPRHLGQHSGGMVICAGELDAVVPLERARMPGRVVVQWDKEDCADLGIVKVDLLGLGMMAVLEESAETIRSRGGSFDLARIPPDDPETYRMIRAADTVGVFQIESRAQMATLPRIRPTKFYDLVVEVAIIRPGPITGNMVHPYINRRLGREPVRYPHPSLEPILKRTLGVPLFQEQLLRIAMVAAGFTGGQAEQLRRAMGFKRSAERMAELEGRLRQGLADNGIVGDPADEIVRSISSFALYGFPESHSASFALLAYASSYLKAHYPAEFLAALLNCQPMGFYSPAVLVKDAQRHGVRVLPIDVNLSDVRCVAGDAPGQHAHPQGAPASQVRLGLLYVGGLRAEASAAVVEERARRGRFRSITELARRVSLQKAELDVLAEIGALNPLGQGMHRREALWQVESACHSKGPLFDGRKSDVPAPGPLAPMTPMERIEADYRGAGLTVGRHPMHYLRQQVASLGALSSRGIEHASNGSRVRVAGAVITRQRPGTAKGFCFITLEDEEGVANLILAPRRFQAHRNIATSEPFLLAEGILQIADGTVAVKVESLQALRIEAPSMPSHDFH